MLSPRGSNQSLVADSRYTLHDSHCALLTLGCVRAARFGSCRVSMCIEVANTQRWDLYCRHLVPCCVPWPRRTPDTLGKMPRLRAFRFLVASGVGGEVVGLGVNTWLVIQQRAIQGMSVARSPSSIPHHMLPK